MRNKHISPAEQQMRQRLCAALAEEDRKFGNQWKHSGGKLERWCKGIYYVFSVYALIVYAINELILLAAGSTESAYISSEKQAFFANNGWIVHGLILLAVAAFVVRLCKKEWGALTLQTLVVALTVLQIAQISVGEYENATLLLVLYCITFVAFLALLAIAVIRLLDRNRLNRAVEKEYHKIYQQYGNEDTTMLTAQQLDEILLSYETALAKGETPPKPKN